MKLIQVTNSAGREYGHVPGHQYHDVDVTIVRTRFGRWSVEIVETWGSCQGRDEEYGRRTVMARGRTLDESVEKAGARAQAANINEEYLTEALSCAEAEAADREEKATEAAQSRRAPALSSFSTEQLLAELRSRKPSAI